MPDSEKRILSLLGLDDIDGMSPDLALTVLSILGAAFKLIQSRGDSIARQEALMRAAENIKAALDREKFPNEPQA